MDCEDERKTFLGAPSGGSRPRGKRGGKAVNRPGGSQANAAVPLSRRKMREMLRLQQHREAQQFRQQPMVPLVPLITPSVAEMNARIQHYKELAEEWELKFHEKNNATIEMFKTESEWHKSRADRLEEKVKDLEQKLSAKAALQREGIIRAFEVIGITTLKRRIAEVFHTESIKQAIDAALAPQLTLEPPPSLEEPGLDIKCELIEYLERSHKK